MIQEPQEPQLHYTPSYHQFTNIALVPRLTSRSKARRWCSEKRPCISYFERQNPLITNTWSNLYFGIGTPSFEQGNYIMHARPRRKHMKDNGRQLGIKLWSSSDNSSPKLSEKSHLIKTAEIFRFPFGTQPTNQPTGLVQLEPGFATQHKYKQVFVTLSIWGKQITKWLHFWLDESITSYSEAINYLGLFHLYQDNRAASERQKPATIALHQRPPRRQHWRQ